MIIAYEALDGNGTATRDTVEAVSVGEATELLRGRGLYVTHVAEKRTPTLREPTPTSVSSSTSFGVKTLALFTRQMAMLFNAGSAVVPAVTAIRRQMLKPKQVAVLDILIADLEGGVMLATAMRNFPRTFDPVYCAIVAAGEASGNLARMFERLAEIVGKRRAMRNKILAAMTYPLVLVVMSFHILLVLLFFVLPRFNDMFVQLGVETPASTQMLLATGAFLQSSWPILLVGLIAGVAMVIALIRSAPGRQWLADVQLLIPGIGALRSRLIQGQIFRTMGTLLNSRVGLLETLDLAREATSCRKFHALFDTFDEVVTSGGELSSALIGSGMIQPYICQAVKTGEESGNLGEALLYCADVLDETNTELVDTITRLIEPAILVFMGFVVGGVAVSLFLPLFDMTSAMQ